jgi:hypothetical protein
MADAAAEAEDEDAAWGSYLTAPFAHLTAHGPDGACMGAELYLLGLQLEAVVLDAEARLADLGIPADGLRSWPTQTEIAYMLRASGMTRCRHARQEALLAIRRAVTGKN